MTTAKEAQAAFERVITNVSSHWRIRNDPDAKQSLKVEINNLKEYHTQQVAIEEADAAKQKSIADIPLNFPLSRG